MTDQHDTLTAELPTPAAGPQMRMVEVALIEESTTNPRKHFDQAKLRELADSIASSGVHQPVLLRPLPGHRVPETWGFRRQGAPLPEYELVAGARRLRACRLAQVKELPALIRRLTDEQALEIQVIENLQREDVTPLEEAEGYEQLMKSAGINADQVAAKVSKSRSYVYARLKILDLCHPAREALRAGTIDFSKALLIARIPDEKLQIKALEYCTQADYQGDTPSQRDCAAYIQRTFMLRLDAARFQITDATLRPEAGSCKDCSKRTGAAPDLFSDVKADLCTDPACYHAKDAAFADRLKAQALERGQQIIEGREAKALIPHDYTGEIDGYVRLDHVADSPTNQPLRRLIGKAMEQADVQPTLIVNPHNGDLVAVLQREQLAPLLAAAGKDDLAKSAASIEKSRAERQKEETKQEAKARYEQAWRHAVVQECWAELKQGNATGVPDNVLRVVIQHYINLVNKDQSARLCKLLGLGKVAPKEGLAQWALDPDADPGTALMLLLAYRDSEYCAWADRYADTAKTANQNPTLHLIAQECGVNVKTVQAAVKEEIRAAEAKAQAAAEAQKASLPLPPAAQAPGVRGRDNKGKKGAKTAATAAPGLTAEEAMQGIASAMQGLEAAAASAPTETAEPGGALAPQGQEGAALDGASSAPQGPGLAPDQPAPPPGQPAIGRRARVNGTVTTPTLTRWIGKTGTITRQVGPEAWDLTFRGRNGGVAGFHITELDVIEEAA